jgi:hypothetical protein
MDIKNSKRCLVPWCVVSDPMMQNEILKSCLVYVAVVPRPAPQCAVHHAVSHQNELAIARRAPGPL